MTLNLTTASPILISRPNHRASTAASVETAVGKTSKFNGQTDDVSRVLKKLSLVVGETVAPSSPSCAAAAFVVLIRVNLGVLLPVQVVQGRGMHGELAGNHGTAKSRGNNRREA